MRFWKKTGRLMVCFFILWASGGKGASPGVNPTQAADVEELRRQMDQLRADYELRMRTLEERLQQMEAVRPSVPEDVSVTDSQEGGAAGEKDVRATARAFMNSQFRPATESRDVSMSMEQKNRLQLKLEHIAEDFVDITGYFRAGYGVDRHGDPQQPYQAPGALSKYRLGNETQNYGELVLGRDFYMGGLGGRATDAWDRSGPIAHVQLRLAFQADYDSGYNNIGTLDLALPELWASVGQIVPTMPEAKIWAGSRFYRRYDIHIVDFFFYNMSGMGGGVEDLSVGAGKIALAYLANPSGSAAYSSEILPNPENKHGFNKGNFDLRWYDVPAPGGRISAGAVLAHAEGGLDAISDREVPSSWGGALTLMHEADRFLDENSVNRFSIQVGSGAAKTFSSGFETYSKDGDLYLIPEVNEAWRVRLTESCILQPSDLFSVAPSMVYQYTDYGSLGAFGGTRHWLSAGVRPMLHLTPSFSLALETGIDYTDTDGRVDQAGDTHGLLWKCTLAPQFAFGRHFMSRPAVRLYLTYAGWTEGFKGLVGGDKDFDETWGLSAGLQMEAWW